MASLMCLVCGRRLKHKKSVNVGAGPVCARKSAISKQGQLFSDDGEPAIQSKHRGEKDVQF